MRKEDTEKIVKDAIARAESLESYVEDLAVSLINRNYDLEDRIYKLEKEKATQLGNLSQVEKIGKELGNELIQMIDSE